MVPYASVVDYNGCLIDVWSSTGGHRSVKLLCYQGCLLRGGDIQTRKERREGLDWEVVICGIQAGPDIENCQRHLCVKIWN